MTTSSSQSVVMATGSGSIGDKIGKNVKLDGDISRVNSVIAQCVTYIWDYIVK